MKNLDKIVKYLRAYQHYCYIQSNRQPCKTTPTEYNERFRDIDKIIKELMSNTE